MKSEIGTLHARPLFAVGTGRCGTHLLHELLSEERAVSAHHELDPLASAFARWVDWNRLPVDLTAFVELKRQDVARASASGRRYFEASAYLSLAVERLASSLDANFVLLVRHPADVVRSLYDKNWYATEPRRSDGTLASGYDELGRPHHAFSRLEPRGPDYERWKRRSRIGKLAWYWRTINKAVLDAFARLPPRRCTWVRVEDLSFDVYRQTLAGAGIEVTVPRARFEEIVACRPGRLPASTALAELADLELDELGEEVDGLARHFGYEPVSARVRRERPARATSRAPVAAVRPARAARVAPRSLIVTVGARNSSREDIAWMLERGVRQFRVNCARGPLARNLEILQALSAHRRAAPLTVVADLPGSKMRIGRFRDGASRRFEAGLELSLVPGDLAEGDTNVAISTPELFSIVARDQLVTFSGSELVLRVGERSEGGARARVLVGGTITKFTGVWLSGPCRPYERLWQRDREVLEALASADVDFVAASFADTPAIVAQVRKHARPDVGVVAKVESPAGIAAFTELVAAADAIMIGRDDLGRWLSRDAIDEWIERRYRDAVASSKPFIAASHYVDSATAGEPLTERERSALAHAFESGLCVCLSETAATSHWRAAISGALDVLARSDEEVARCVPA